MPMRNARPYTFKAHGLSDAADGTNAFPGAMQLLQNLVPAPDTPQNFTCRPASTVIATLTSGLFGGNLGRITAAFMVVNTVYGMVQCTSGTYAGRDIPFGYDVVNLVQVPIPAVPAATCPLSQGNTAGWTPPAMVMISNLRIMISHPGYDGATRFVGWFDFSNFTNNTLTASTHIGTNVIDTFSASPLAAGYRPGMKIAGTNIPANTFIETVTATQITVSNNSTANGAAVALTVTGGTTALPNYYSGQTVGQPLIAVAASVGSMNGRCWYATKNSVQFSDALDPLVITNASQALVLGDSSAVTCLASIPLASPVTGGVIQSLIAFKSAQAPWQITGDQATTNLTTAQISGGIGTLAPATVRPTPKGLAYIAPDGLRFITLAGEVTPVVGAWGQGVSIPFQRAVNPSRMAAAFNVSIYRVSVTNGAKVGTPLEDYWYDIQIDRWTGPHTFPPSVIVPYTGSSEGSLVSQPLGNGQGFILAVAAVNATLYLSLPRPDGNSTFTENGVALGWQWRSCLMPDNQMGSINTIVESTYAIASVGGNIAPTITPFDEEGNTLADSVTVVTTSPGALQQYRLPWDKPLVFKQMSVLITANSSAGMELGNFYAKFQPLGYTLQT